MSWCTPDAASKLSAVHDPFAVKLFERLPPGGSRPSDLASLRRAHASSALPNAEAEVDREASAVR